jgi:hypothetical protein
VGLVRKQGGNMRLLMTLNRLKNPRTIKEWIIKYGQPSWIDYSKSLNNMLRKNEAKILPYIANYTKEDLRFIKKVLKNNTFFCETISILKNNKVEDFKLYKEVKSASAHSFQESYIMLLEASKTSELAKKILQRTRTIVVFTPVSHEPFVYKIGVVDVPKLLWDRHSSCRCYSDLYKEVFNCIPEHNFIWQKDVKCDMQWDELREFRIAEIIGNITKDAPIKIGYIERVIDYLRRLPKLKLERVWERCY